MPAGAGGAGVGVVCPDGEVLDGDAGCVLGEVLFDEVNDMMSNLPFVATPMPPAANTSMVKTITKTSQPDEPDFPGTRLPYP